MDIDLSNGTRVRAINARVRRLCGIALVALTFASLAQAAEVDVGRARALLTAYKCYLCHADNVTEAGAIRHTTAMRLLQAGVDISVIALWLCHESPATTHHYVEADLTIKVKKGC